MNKAQQNAENLAARVDQGASVPTTDSGNAARESHLLILESTSNGKSGADTSAGASPRAAKATGDTSDKSNPDGNQFGASISSRSPEEVSKEELLDILQKMNKRVKALSALRITLTDRVKSSEKDRSRLVEFLKDEVLTPADIEEASIAAAEKNAQIASKQAESADGVVPNAQRFDEIGVLEMAWRAVDERNSLSLQAIQSEYKNLTLQHQSELEKLQEAVRRGGKVESALAGVDLRSETDESVSAQDENAHTSLAELVSKHEEEMKQMQRDHQSEIEQMRKNIAEPRSSERYLSKEDHELKLKEAKLDTAKQVKEAYEKKLSVIKEKAKTYVEKTKRDSDLQLEAARNEVDVARRNLEEGKSQSDYNNDAKEIANLRTQLEEHQATLQAARESQSEAASQVEQVKGSLSETAALLKQSKEKEEATVAELEDMRAKAVEAANVAETARAAEAAATASATRAAQDTEASFERRLKDTEVSFEQRLKDELEGQRAAHDASIQSLQAQHQDETTRLQSMYDELSSSVGKEKDDEVMVLRRTFEAEKKVLQDESFAKLQTALQKHGKAMDYIKKLKAATSDKLKQIGEERVAERSRWEGENSTIRDQLASFSKEADDMKATVRTLKEELAQAKEMNDDRDRHVLEKDIEERISQAVQVLDLKHKSVLQAREKEKTELFEDLQARHSEALEAIRGEKQNEFDELKTSFSARLQALKKENLEAKSDLEGKMAKHADELKAFYDEKLKTAVADGEASEEVLSSLRVENESLCAQLREQSSVQKEMRQKIHNLQEEMKLKSANNVATAQSLVKEQELLLEETKVLKKTISTMKEAKKMDDQAMESLQGQVQDLTMQIGTLQDQRLDLEDRVCDAARKENKLSVTEAELSALREEVNQLKLTESKSSSLVTRLQSEKEASERKHGQQTALIGMLETQLGELNESSSEIRAQLEAAVYDSGQKDETIVAIRGQLEKSEKSLAQQASRKTQNESFAQHVADKESAKRAKIIDTQQKELQSLQQQMVRKSTAAQRLLQEREAECSELRKTNKTLQNEVDKGSLSDRRIFELAAQQSNRESVATAEIELRDKLVKRLAEKLESRDSELASAEYTVQKVEGQVEELCRVQRREDVNLDYLKSIVVQYLSKPPGSSERAALLPVLATLLQFDASDYDAIEAGKANLSWWGSIVPKEIAAPSPPPATAPPSRPTHLQF